VRTAALHARVGDWLYLHGSTGARALQAARGAGLKVCVTVTLTDGLVLARSAFHHSINYRSVVAHGTAHLVDDDAERHAALAALVEAVAPGRTEHTRPPSRKELAATAVLRLELAAVSLKVRQAIRATTRRTWTCRTGPQSCRSTPAPVSHAPRLTCPPQSALPRTSRAGGTRAALRRPRRTIGFWLSSAFDSPGGLVVGGEDGVAGAACVRTGPGPR
jgi:nitroimidazol reductase NimA-like FMN-containing flavoprotein (pyridoxamine 5'-phosphate oxidase superfamily)